MNIGVSPEEISEVFQNTYPKEYSIVVLSIINDKQARRIASLEEAIMNMQKTEEAAESQASDDKSDESDRT